MGDITARYLEAARAKLNEKSDKRVTNYRLSKELNTSEANISRYFNKNIECEDDDLIVRIAKIAQVPPLEIIAKIHEKKAESPETKAIWSALLSSKGNNQYILCKIQNYFDSVRNRLNPPSNYKYLMA
jgi:hypothetical protein